MKTKTPEEIIIQVGSKGKWNVNKSKAVEAILAYHNQFQQPMSDSNKEVIRDIITGGKSDCYDKAERVIAYIEMCNIFLTPLSKEEIEYEWQKNSHSFPILSGMLLMDSGDFKNAIKHLLSRVEDKQPKEEEKPDWKKVIKMACINFGVWYSGMDKNKVESQYARYCIENLHTDEVRSENNNPVMGRNSCLLDYTFPGGKFYNENSK